MTLLQPQAPEAKQTEPAVELVQSPQTACPVSAQSAAVFPGAQVPLVDAEQQPPLQGWVELQAVVQAWVVRLQALPVGQSAAALQPQAPLTHWSPAEALVQLIQLPPAGPHAVALMATHWLVEPQQKPAPQFPPAVPPTTHWAEQVLFRQVGVLPLQATQMSPLPPQAPLLVPAVQVLFEQQPPLQSCVGPQTLVHLWFVVLQA